MTVWVCVLLSLLSIVAYSGFSNALSGSGQPPIEVPASPSIAPTPQSLNTPVGPIALDASSNRPAPDSTRKDDNLAAGLSEYVYLHRTRDERIPAKTTAGINVCSE